MESRVYELAMAFYLRLFAPSVKEILPPWTVNSLAQAVGAKALKDSAYQQKTRQICSQLRLEMENRTPKNSPAESLQFGGQLFLHQDCRPR